MAKLFLGGINESKQTKKSSSWEIARFFWRIILSNKSLFFGCSLLAFVTAVINSYANYFSGALAFRGLEKELLKIKIDSYVFNFKEIPKWLVNFLFTRETIRLRSFIIFLVNYLIFFKATSSIAHWYVNSYCVDKIEKDLKNELFEILVGSDYEKSSEESTKMLTQFSSDIDTIASNTWLTSNRVIYVITSIFINVVLVFRDEKGSFAVRLLVLIASLFGFFFLVTYFLMKRSIKFAVEAKKRYEQNNRFVFERISNLEYIKSTSSEQLEKDKLNNYLNDAFKKNQVSLLSNTLFRSIPEYLVAPNIPVFFVLAIVFIQFFKDKVESLEALTMYIWSISRINNEVAKIFNSIIALEELSTDFSLVMNSVNFLTSNQNSDLNQGELDFTVGNIVFDKVTFAYPSRPQNNIIENFSFTFENGKKYGIAGKNGIGKSTITKILLKLYKISGGSVLINQQNLSAIDTTKLHHNICRLNNRPSFFNMSIAENIFYPFLYNKDYDLKKLVYAAKQTRIFAFIKSLPAGFDTVLREGGIDLSEGQKQQIEAMKVFIKDYQIYIFDEILSNVHPSTRKVILQNIFADVKNKLVIVIDHHYDIFVHTDYVYIFSSKKLTYVRNLEKLLEKHPEEEKS